MDKLKVEISIAPLTSIGVDGEGAMTARLELRTGDLERLTLERYLEIRGRSSGGGLP